MDEFRSLLLAIGNDIEHEQFESMKFYCKTQIGAAILERLILPIHMFNELEKRTLLGPTKKDFLADLLVKVGRMDLSNKLLGIVEVQSSSRSTVPNAPIVTGTINEVHFVEIAEELAQDWKQLGRKLGISSNRIDGIDTDNKKVKEKGYQVLLQWKRRNGGEATGQALADKLTLIGRKDVAEHLADICHRDNNVTTALPQAPAENAESQEPLETMPGTLKNVLPGGPKQETERLENKGRPRHPDNTVTDGPCHVEPQPAGEKIPTQDTANPPTTQRLGHILDPKRYFVVEQIGSGSCGKVYWCQTKDRLHNYAVKQVDLGMNNKETQEQVKHLKKEIEILKRLRHDNIVTYYFSEDTAQTLSIFMEYIPGGSVFDYVMNNGAMHETLARKYTFQMLTGLEYLHQNNLIHRDIKGANVLIDGRKNIRLVDFGIAKDLQSVLTSTGSTTKAVICGTIYWCSPEHFKPDESPTHVLDIWSVGCTVVEMLTTKPPNRHLNTIQVYSCILSGDVHAPEHLSSLAKTFIGLCFKVKGERPNATDLLKDEFPSAIATDDEND